jgi:hypothetical protein
MAITVKHSKVSTIPDDADTSLVRPSDWNADHTLVGLGTMAEQDANNVNITGGTIANATLTSPKINEILDTNGNEVLGLLSTASATDYLAIKNGIGVGVPLHISSEGSSTNIGLHIQPKGTGLVTISDGTDFNKGIRFRSSGSAASAITLLDAVSSSGHVVTLPDATTTLVGRNTTDTLTNKRINPRVLASTANSATPTINTDLYDMVVITAQSVAITSFTTNLSGTPVNGQKLWISITGTTAIAITWGASFEASTATLPTTTVSTNRLDVGFVWNVATTKWRCVAVA